MAPLFYTTPGDDGAIAVTCNRCLQSVGCPDPDAAASAITHHHCQPDTTMAGPEDRDLALDQQQPALHLLAGLWVASCPTCGFQLASARSQVRCERRATRTTCPVCYEVA